MPRTEEQNREIKKIAIAKIKEAGLQLFATKGLAATSIADISKEAGISVGLMYHYYKSKDDLYAELVGEAVTGANSMICQIVKMNLSPSAKVVMLVENILVQMKANDHAVRFFVFMPQVILNRNLPAKAKPMLKDANKALDVLESIIMAGQQAGEIREGSPAALSTLFFATITGLCTYKLMIGKKFVFPSVEMLTGILMV